MADLPRIEDLPRSEHGYEPEAVAEALAAYRRRLGELEAKLEVLDELREELRRLRSPGPAPRVDEEGWPDEAPPPLPPPEAAWVAAVPPPVLHPSPLPRLALEAGFLLLVAFLSALADLAPLAIAGVMAVAWILVALAEWSAAAARHEPASSPSAPALEDTQADGSAWDVPPVEPTVVVPPDDSESHTVVARMPPLPEAPAPRRRLLGLRSRRERQPVRDPWEDASGP